MDLPAGATEIVLPPSQPAAAASVNETGASSEKVKTVTLARYLKAINAKEDAEKQATQPGMVATLMQLMSEDDPKVSLTPEVAVIMAEGPIVQG